MEGGATTLPTALANVSGPARELALRVVYSPDRAQCRSHPVAGSDLVLIGRDVSESNLRLTDPRLSRLHVRIAFDPRAQMYRVGDAGSSNGTFVNGARIDTALLRPGDVIRAGDSVLVFAEDTAQAEAERTDALARSELSLLLCGETGTGKEVLARSIHERSERTGKFVAMNCAALPRELIAAELFGHTRGAFSGAHQARPGLFMAAERGTLLLDEVGDLPLELQPALLRVLQEKRVRPVGADQEVPMSARILAASHVDLKAAVDAQRFRADLYARLAQYTIRLPALRDRRADVLALFDSLSVERGVSLALSADVAEALTLWSWPFNVRELVTLVSAACVLCRSGATIDLELLRELHPEAAANLARSRARSSASDDEPAREGILLREQLENLLKEHAGNVARVATQLGKPRSQVYRWLRTYGLSAERHRDRSGRSG